MKKTESSPPEHMHILVIDDDPQILLLMKEILEQEFIVHAFATPALALPLVDEMLDERTPVIAGFIDLMLEEASGIEVAKTLRQLDSRINVILMTGNPNFSSQDLDPSLVDQLLLLQKPFSVDEVLLQARFFQRTWLRDRDLEAQKSALKRENQEREAIAARNQAVLETALDCIITIDSQGRIIEWNPAAERTFGFVKDDILGKKLSETIVPHGLRSGHESGMSHYRDTGEGPILGQRIEVPALHVSGRQFPVELTVNPIKLGKATLFTAYLRDISAQQEAAAQLQLQSAALEAAANGIVITDPQGRIVWGNSSFSILTGYTEDEILGKPMSILKSHLHDQNFYKDMWETIRSGEVWVGEIRNRRKNGDIYTEEMTITPVKNGDDEISHFIAIKQDVTAQRQIDAKLDQSEQNQRIINYFATSLLGSNTVDEILWDITHNCISELGLEDAVVYLVSEDGTHLTQKAAFGTNKAKDGVVLNPIEIPMGEGIVGSVASSGRAEIIPNIHEDRRYILDDQGRSSELAVPILYENKVIGVIDSEHSQVEYFQEHHLQILEAIASLASNKIMRARSLELIEQSERKYRNIFESIQDVYAEVDYETGQILEISPSVLRASGYGRDDMIGQPIGDFFSPKGVPAELMNVLMETGEVNDYTVSMVNGAGELRSVSFSVSLIRNEAGEPDKIVGTMRDITERKRVMRQVQESEQRLKSILNSLPTGVVISDPTTCMIVETNPAAAQIMGLVRDEIVDKRTTDVLALDDDRFMAAGTKTLEAPQDVILTRKSGEKVPILISRLPLTVNDQDLVLLSFVDNSMQKEAEASLKTNIEMKTNFVSNLSHELRTPMTSIYGFAGTILRDENMPDEVRQDFTRIIFEESQRLTRLIENVLDLSRMEAGRMNYNMQPLQFDVLIADALKTQQVLIRDKDINLVQEIMNDPPLIRGDHDSLNQLIINLVSNAIKFSDPGATVGLTLESTGSKLVLQVNDSGIGIPETDLPHIFDKFYRVVRKGREDQGTGIGLAIVKEIVDRHNGSISVKSVEGQGTTFAVSFETIGVELNE